MKISEDLLQKALMKRAKTLARAGYSPIPVQGNNAPSEPKRPAVSWRKFQRRIATDAEIDLLFKEKVTALGIVCGRVSKLLVIDFDDVLRYQRFCRHLPQFAETYTVKTKRGFHLYFRTMEKVPSHQFDGGDVKAERSYVVAPPSAIGDFVYRCINKKAKRELLKHDVDQLLNYFHVKSAGHVLAGSQTREREDVDMGRLYRRLAPRMGRNNALYRVASIGREANMSKAEVEKQLLRAHGEMPGHRGHKKESLAERWQEGMRTIASAFMRASGAQHGKVGIANSIREQLLKAQRSTVVARLLDIFVLAGWQVDAYFSLKDAEKLGERFGLNRKSVMQALTGDHSSYDGRHIISRRYVEYLDIEGLKGPRRGRPVELAFQVPSVSRLLSVLNVRRSPSDVMRIEDVSSAKAYRMAVHREYVRRLSPRSSLAVLAARLGLNERTIRRYNRALDVQLTACVGRLKLTREALDWLPKRGWLTRSNSTKGFWLEAHDGRRLPAWRHLGSRLLKAGEGDAQICVRHASVFSLEGEARAPLQFEELSLRQVARLLVLRSGAEGSGGLRSRLNEAVEAARKRAAVLRYQRVPLSFESVDARIAEDKVAETINGYLCARDEAGLEVRRPARRGIAYRMLKEFGNGNVYLALRSTYKDVLAFLARHALRAGAGDQGLDLLAQTMA